MRHISLVLLLVLLLQLSTHIFAVEMADAPAAGDEPAEDDASEEAAPAEGVEAAAEEAEEEEEAAAEEAAEDKASVQFVVTAKMRAKLTELGYGDAEISDLSAERAAAIISRGIRCPKAGVPASWNRGGPRSASGGSPIKAFRGIVAKPLKAVGVPDAAVAPALLVLGGLAAALSLGLGPFGGGAVAVAVSEALAEPMPEEAAPKPSRGNENDLWLDRQIDKVIDALKGVVGR